jgi:hypothetical protein
MSNWKKYGIDCRCYISSNGKKITCYKCDLACCEEAIQVSCVCLYCYECAIHNKHECYGSHS